MTHFWKKNWFLWATYALLAVVVSMFKLRLPLSAEGYTAYENYLIFKNSAGNLLDYSNPYAYFFNQAWDQFKYSPAFALAMWPFAQLPDALGLPLWNLLNALVLLGAILHLPVLAPRQRHFMAWFVLLELVTSMQNSQSNGLTAGLFLWAFIAFERGRMAQAGAWVVLNGFVKIFGGLGGLMMWIYPQQRKFLLWATGWTVALTVLPLVFLSPEQTVRVYGWWWDLLRQDHAASVGLSVQGWLQTWLGLQPPKILVMGAGLAVLAASIVRVSSLNLDSSPFAVVGVSANNTSGTDAKPESPLRRLLLAGTPTAATTTPELQTSNFKLRTLLWASLLIWSVIFNHKAESPTFVIAMCGVALWYCVSKQKRWETVFLWVTFALVSLSPTDIFPRFVREHLVQPYVLKAVPCIVLWGWISWKILAPKKR